MKRTLYILLVACAVAASASETWETYLDQAEAFYAESEYVRNMRS